MSISGTPTPCYLRFWVQFHTRSLEHHMNLFCPNDLSHCVNGKAQKHVVASPLVPTVWLIQEGIDLTQKEVTTLK